MSPLVPYTRQGESFDFSPKQEMQSLLYSADKEIRLHNYPDKSEYLIVTRPSWVTYLASHNGLLVDASDYGYGGTIRETLSDEVIAKRRLSTRPFASHNGVHYDVSYYRKIREIPSGKVIADRPEEVKALAVYNGRLIDAGLDGIIRETLSDKPIVTVQHKTLRCLLPISQDQAESLLALPGVRKLE
jgi:hypothetical protein